MLQPIELAQVIKNTPIIAVDFIIENKHGKILLGKRNNSPAKGYYFTFGGIILKDEKISQAIERVSRNELGLTLRKEMLSFNGIFEFFWDENFLGNTDFSSHYIVLSYHFKDNEGLIHPNIFSEKEGYYCQHSQTISLSPEEILADPTIHPDLKPMISSFYARNNPY